MVLTASPLSPQDETVEFVLHFGNASLTDSSWRSVLWGPMATRVLGPLEPLWDKPLFGVDSLSAAQTILGEFRTFLGELVAAADRQSGLHDLLTEMFQRANLKPAALIPNLETGTIFVAWETKDNSFVESLYARLALALETVPLRRIRRCDECQQFFYEPNDRRLRFCGSRCRNRSLVKRYRQEHRDEHREYQRNLMRLRRSRKAQLSA